MSFTKFTSPPKEGEIWLTKSGNIALLIIVDNKLMMEWYDPLEGYTCSNIFNRLERLANEKEKKQFYTLRQRWTVV